MNIDKNDFTINMEPGLRSLHVCDFADMYEYMFNCYSSVQLNCYNIILLIFPLTDDWRDSP